MQTVRIFGLLVTILSLLSSCTEVRAWERGYLAKDEMAWESDSLESALNDHIFFSKEASSGGNSAAGGGCGCN
ncbi:MAG: hypothetical protein COA96_17575 [SAR86 cluster bacterium]|uniref:DUF4266 domain-containing protein n=1 Tax=SAR86 cluster bacterium TaxID=2030880 RepID=A0A2A5AFV6_9GAMM|nr:MAG: hypothetical protein COA96_17575 [SAR86 cluster bacterium]